MPTPLSDSSIQNDNHPPLSIAFGENFILRLYQALSAAPISVSSRTVLIAIHDEHGGFWDHVPPHPTPGYTSISGTQFATTGPRVPAFIVSPLVSGQRAITDLLFDHTSILQFIAECFAPGGGSYSHEVDLRAGYGVQQRSHQVLDLASPRALPIAPDFPVTAPITLQTSRPILTGWPNVRFCPCDRRHPILTISERCFGKTSGASYL